jgi:hypothetical protein
MKRMAMLAGVVALAFAGPALAKPGKGQGNPHANVNAYGVNGPVGYGVGGCPPGLAKKAVPCVPPGQVKKMYGVGERLPMGVFNPYGFNHIPLDLRTRYTLNPNGTYYYGNGYLYRVDPRTMMVQQTIAALLSHP